MTDGKLIGIFADMIDEMSAAEGWQLKAVQLDQPRQSAVVDGGAIYFTILPDRRHGFQEQNLRWHQDKNMFVQTENQQLISAVQISVVLEQVPGAVYTTPKDVANILAMRFASFKRIAEMRTHNLGILRITEVQNQFIVGDDRERYEAMPSFIIEFTRLVTIKDDVPKIEAVKLKLDRV